MSLELVCNSRISGLILSFNFLKEVKYCKKSTFKKLYFCCKAYSKITELSTFFKARVSRCVDVVLITCLHGKKKWQVVNWGRFIFDFGLDEKVSVARIPRALMPQRRCY